MADGDHAVRHDRMGHIAVAWHPEYVCRLGWAVGAASGSRHDVGRSPRRAQGLGRAGLFWGRVRHAGGLVAHRISHLRCQSDYLDGDWNLVVEIDRTMVTDAVARLATPARRALLRRRQSYCAFRRDHPTDRTAHPSL